MLFLLNRENYKFLLHWQWLCPMHKEARRRQHPWIIAPRSRCYSAETNSSDKICTRLIVYSCFMARCNLNTFMISLKAEQRQRSLPSEAALFLHLDSYPPSDSSLAFMLGDGGGNETGHHYRATCNTVSFFFLLFSSLPLLSDWIIQICANELFSFFPAWSGNWKWPGVTPIYYSS